MRGRSHAAPVAAIVGLALLVGCTTEDAPPRIATGMASSAAERPFTAADVDIPGARLYSPARGPVALTDWRDLPAPATPVPAVIYLPACSTPAAPRDHIPFLQRQGVAVLVPSLAGFGCVDPDEPFANMRIEIERLAEELMAVPWIDDDRLYLMGHSVGADLATSFAKTGIFEGVVGLAAACTFGVNNAIPTVTFRALDDPVLAIRRTRCTELDSPNALHLEFAGSDHVMRLNTGGNGGRQLAGRAIAQFMGVAGGPAAATIADADALDLQQLAAPRNGDIDAAGSDPLVRDEPLFDAPVVEDAPLIPPASTDEPTPAIAEDGILYLPSLNLTPGTL